MSPTARYAAVTAGLFGCAASLALTVGDRYGSRAGRRFGAGIGAGVLAQQCLVAVALRRYGSSNGRLKRHAVSLVDAITLSRAGTGALMLGIVSSGVRDRRGRLGWLGWVALIYGAIVSDWLDGPIARRLGTSDVGAMLDIEADSWLTLSTSAVAVSAGGLPAYVVAAPLLRYLRIAALGRLVPYQELVSGDPLWTRHVGMAQMMLFIAALAPFGGRLTRLLVRLGAPVVVIGQLLTLTLMSWRKLKVPRSHWHESR